MWYHLLLRSAVLQLVFFQLPDGVRFIAVANGFDSSKPETNKFAPFPNIIKEWYLRDQSRKVKAFFRQRGMSGKPITNALIYSFSFFL